MPINPDQQLDPNKRRYGLPLDSVVGNGVGDPHAGGKPAPRTSQRVEFVNKGGDPYAGGKSIGKAAAQK